MAKLKKLSCYFSGDASISKIISYEVEEAKKYVYLAMYTLTDRYLIDTLKNVCKKGINVLAVFDEAQLLNFPEIMLELVNSDIQFKTIGKETARMHHKFIVIDDSKLITGSFNWTRQANASNMENIIIAKDKNIALDYLSEFNRIWKLITSDSIDHHSAIEVNTNRFLNLHPKEEKKLLNDLSNSYRLELTEDLIHTSIRENAIRILKGYLPNDFPLSYENRFVFMDIDNIDLVIEILLKLTKRKLVDLGLKPKDIAVLTLSDYGELGSFKLNKAGVPPQIAA